MNDQVKKEWVAALRSGDYQQGTDYLRAEDPDGEQRFCCLGVLCDLYHKQFPQIDWMRRKEKQPDGRTPYEFNKCAGILPLEVRAWAGFSDLITEMPALTIHTQRGGFAFHNDSGATFAEIADAIEGQL